MDDAELKEYRAKRGMAMMHFPTVLGADVPMYNIPGVTTELKFTPEPLPEKVGPRSNVEQYAR